MTTTPRRKVGKHSWVWLRLIQASIFWFYLLLARISSNSILGLWIGQKVKIQSFHLRLCLFQAHRFHRACTGPTGNERGFVNEFGCPAIQISWPWHHVSRIPWNIRLQFVWEHVDESRNQSPQVINIPTLPASRTVYCNRVDHQTWCTSLCPRCPSRTGEPFFLDLSWFGGGTVAPCRSSNVRTPHISAWATEVVFTHPDVTRWYCHALQILSTTPSLNGWKTFPRSKM